jgi:hypothetical protein
MNSVQFRLGTDVYVGLGDVMVIGKKVFRILAEEDEIFDLQEGDGCGEWKSILRSYRHGLVLEVVRHVIEDVALHSVQVIKAGSEPATEVCTWTYTDSEGYYATSCGQAFVFNYHPAEPQFIGCPYCMKCIQWKEEEQVVEEDLA